MLAFLIAVLLQPSTVASPELRISYEEFKKLYDSGEVLVLDTRSLDAYRAGHIPGAVSLPLGTVEAKSADLAKEKRPIVTYCA